MTLSRQLSLVVFSAAAGAAVAISAVAYFVMRDAVGSAIADRQLDAANQLIDKVDRMLGERRNDMLASSEDQAIVAAVAHATNAADTQRANARLKQLATLTGPWETLDIIGRDNTIVASLNKTTIGHAAKMDDIELSVIHQAQSGEVASSDAFLDTSLGKLTILIAAPIRQTQNPGRPIVATVIGRLSWNAVLEMLRSASTPRVSLYNHSGLEIGNNDDPKDILVDSQAADPIIQKAQAHQEGTAIALSSERETEVLVSYTYEKGFGNYTGNNWVLTLETPTILAYAPAYEDSFKLVVSLVIIVAMGAAAALVLIARSVRPITSLSQSAMRLASGDIRHRFKVTTKNEFGQLGSALNNMADTLQQLYQNLEAKVKAKTVRLALRAREAEANSAKDEAILSSIGEGLVVVNNDGRIIRINRQALQILGFTIERMIGRKILDTVLFYSDRGEPLAANQRPTIKALEHGELTEATYQIQRSDGVKVLIAVITNPVRIKGETVGAIMVIRDVTKEHEIDRMKTEFISLASHQLRTPLSAIKWFTEMLVAGDAGKLNDDQHDFAVNIYDSAQRMIQLVNSLLNISRIESGRLIVSPRPTNITSMLDGIVHDLAARLERKHQQLTINVDKTLPNINLDPRLIDQVYLNLLTNAIKYTQAHGHIVVNVKQDGNNLLSEIKDEGYGIPANQQDRIFQKFFRAENAIRIETDGTGLGLYLVKAVVESSGGKIWFESTEGKGSTFWFTLPMSGMKPRQGEVTLDA